MEEKQKQCPIFMHAILSNYKAFGGVPPEMWLCTEKCAWYKTIIGLDGKIEDFECGVVNALQGLGSAIFHGLAGTNITRGATNQMKWLKIEYCYQCKHHIILKQKELSLRPGVWIHSVYGCELTGEKHRHDQKEFPPSCRLKDVVG